jgi:uncharacterized flavoprotein (TIGR03862 family)
MMKKKVAIIGGGTAGLFLAAFLDTKIFEVTIYEKKSTLGRKFLVAGDGGFNLTHSEEPTLLQSRYTPTVFLDDVLSMFSNTDLRSFLASIDIPTFVGSSGRVFPESGIKPIEVLQAMRRHLTHKGVRIAYNKTLTGWNPNKKLEFNFSEVIDADIVVFALGGASWKVTGSEGDWCPLFEQNGIQTISFQPSNCAYQVEWSTDVIQQYEGKPLKNISISIEDKHQKGEVVITKFGLEGNAIYGLSPQIRKALKQENEAIVNIDFKPSLKSAVILRKLKESKDNIATTLKKELKLSKVVIALLRTSLNKEEYTDLDFLSRKIKYFPVKLIGSAPVDEAISTVGGIALDEVNSKFELKKFPSNYCIGEMLDWDAPTGGYLIQACASMGAYLSNTLNHTSSPKA